MKTVIALAIALTSAPIFAGPNHADDELQSHIITLDTQGWEAWKNNDPKWFIANTSDSYVSISSTGISSKADVVKGIPTDCQVKDFSLAGFKFTQLDTNAVLLTYTATQDAVCGGEKAPSVVHVAVNYVRHDGKWLEIMYMQSP